MSLQLMIDIETLSTEPDAAVVSLGACTFMLNENGKIRDQFEVVISAESNQRAGRHVDAGTFMWWLNQTKEAQQALLQNPAPLAAALADFRLWCDRQVSTITDIWANDPDFDVIILSRAFRAVNQMWPFQFYQNRSLRTVQALAFPDPDTLKELKHALRTEHGATHHRAVDDAIIQAKVVQMGYDLLVMQNAVTGVSANAA